MKYCLLTLLSIFTLKDGYKLELRKTSEIIQLFGSAKKLTRKIKIYGENIPSG